MKLDLSKIIDIEVENIKSYDCPDYVDAYISRAFYDGCEMTEQELDDLNNNHSEFVYEAVMKHLY